MKILKLSPYFYPEQISSSHLSADLYEAYRSAGIETELYVPTPTRGINEETYRKYKKIKYEEMYDGFVKVHRFSMFREGKNPVMRAVRYMLVNVCQYFKAISAKNIDVLFAGSTPPTQGILCALVKKTKKIPFVYNLQDIFPDSLVNTGLTKENSFLWKIGRVIENFTYKNADKIIVISEDFKKNIMAKGVPEEKIEVVYNWVDESRVVSVSREKNPLFDKYGLDRSKFYICYSGNIGFTQNMDMLCSVAKDFEGNSDIGFVIVGDGAYKKQLEDIIAERNITNITLIPFQDYKDISFVFSIGDAGLIISKKGVGTNSVPSKTWSIMSAERPVLASFDKGSELDKIITENKCGICVDADDAEALKVAINELYSNRTKLSAMGANGRQFILDNLTKEKGTGKIVQILKEIVPAGREVVKV